MAAISGATNAQIDARELAAVPSFVCAHYLLKAITHPLDQLMKSSSMRSGASA